MVPYVFDTSAFIVLKNFYPETFASLWQNVDELTRSGDLISVREVYNELLNYNDSDFIQDWAKLHKSIFAIPSQEEQLVVSRIFDVPHFQQLIGNKAMLKGTPVADPFVIAAAKVANGAVVTQEQLKPNAAKIPNVCQHFRVPYCDLAGFMRQMGWSF